jgi:hypothetical protein
MHPSDVSFWIGDTEPQIQLRESEGLEVLVSETQFTQDHLESLEGVFGDAVTANPKLPSQLANLSLLALI